MRVDYKHPVVAMALAVSVIAGLSMFYFYFNGYDTSISWSLTTSSDMDEIVAYEFQKGPAAFQLKGEKITLTEAYVGDAINPLDTLSTVYWYVILFGLALLVSCATYLKQTAFIVFSGLFVVFISFLDLTGYFGQSNWVVLVPFVSIIGVAYLFQGFWYQSIFVIRLAAISAVFLVLSLIIPGGIQPFVTHFFANGLLSLLVLAVLFILLVAEEILFGLLYVLTQAKGSRGNAKHLLIMGGIYIANLLGYYLNRAGIFEISYTFMNPYVLLFISFAIALWSLKYKYALIEKWTIFIRAFVATLALGIITFALLGYGFAKGLDGIYEGLHYLIIYAHLAFGFFFLAYIIINFIDPLVKGWQIYKIVYKPQTFHYVTARIVGLITVLAFFVLASQAPLNLFYSAKYNLLGDTHARTGSTDLAITYYKQADQFGYNSHYTNYQLGSAYLSQNKLPAARAHFEKATKRYPSAQAFLNASNLQSESDLSLSTAYLTHGLNYFKDQPELITNLGLIQLRNAQAEKAYSFFSSTQSDQKWNQAPLVNAWAALAQMRDLQNERPEDVYNAGVLATKSNVLSALLSAGRSANIGFDTTLLASSFPLHRQAYLLNASYLFADTVLQQKIGEELEVQGIGIQGQLRKSLVVNLYVSGRVKSAFQLLDFISQGTSGQRAGEVFNEMGLLALDQHAPLEALDFFEKATEYGYSQASFNRLFALLEAGRFTDAEQQLNQLAEVDSTMHSLKKSLANIFRPESDTTSEASFNELYYRGQEWPVEKIKIRLADFTPTAQQMVIRKIAHEIENKGLDADQYAGLSLPLPSFDNIPTDDLVAIALERPFDESLILTAAKGMDSIEAFNLLKSSLEFNPYSILLLKAHALSAIDINLPEYASSSMQQLSQLLSGTDFMTFEKEWYTKKSERTSDWPF